MNQEQILNKILIEFQQETSSVSVENIYFLVNFKTKNIIIKPDNYELQPRERVYSFKKYQGSVFLNLEEEY